MLAFRRWKEYNLTQRCSWPCISVPLKASKLTTSGLSSFRDRQILPVSPPQSKKNPYPRWLVPLHMRVRRRGNSPLPESSCQRGRIAAAWGGVLTNMK